MPRHWNAHCPPIYWSKYFFPLVSALSINSVLCSNHQFKCESRERRPKWYRKINPGVQQFYSSPWRQSLCPAPSACRHIPGIRLSADQSGFLRLRTPVGSSPNDDTSSPKRSAKVAKQAKLTDRLSRVSIKCVTSPALVPSLLTHLKVNNHAVNHRRSP